MWIQTVLPRYVVSNQLLFYSWQSHFIKGLWGRCGMLISRLQSFPHLSHLRLFLQHSGASLRESSEVLAVHFFNMALPFLFCCYPQKCSDHVVSNQTLNMFLPWHSWKDSGQLPRSLWTGKARRGEVEPLCSIWYESLGPSPQKKKCLDHLWWVF